KKKKKKRQSTLSYTRTSSKSEPKHFKELEQSVESTTLRLTCVQRHIKDKRRQRVGQLLCFAFEFCIRICSVCVYAKRK
ncbi:uncharacterized protein MYCGRDRAFT_82650, partial [Zymoseptoria tritici IPO323]